jgi:hypothetical protein
LQFWAGPRARRGRHRQGAQLAGLSCGHRGARPLSSRRAGRFDQVSGSREAVSPSSIMEGPLQLIRPGARREGHATVLPDPEMLGVTVPQGPVLVAADGWRTARDASTTRPLGP